MLNPQLLTSPWSGHRRFAYDLVAFVQPRTIVELGTHYGCSMFSFLQSIKDLRLESDCYAIDSWTGDEHAGHYGNEVFDLVRKTIGKYFSDQRIHLLRKLFDQALTDIPDGSVDLMHIDGFHAYEAVKHDFDTWEPKVAQDGLVLFHDIAGSTGYGSAKYWSELKRRYPHYEFAHHSWGLGILFPKGDFWHREIARAAPDGWQDLYRYRAESELLAVQLSAAEKLCLERWDIMQSMDAMVRERDAAITVQVREIEERRSAVERLEREVAVCREGIETQRQEIAQAANKTETQQQKILQYSSEIEFHLRELAKRDCEIENQRREIIDRRSIIAKIVDSQDIKGLLKLFQSEDREVPFLDLAFSLYLFIERLHMTAKAKEIGDLFFFSREGQILKEMFDYFRARVADPAPIRSHYLEVSRRSTFLPSLGPLDEETFDILFRQYRRISLDAFLASLALEEYREHLAAALGIDVVDLAQVRDDLPTDPLFRQLLRTPAFRGLYERERTARAAALAGYIASFTGGDIVDTLHVVDVGWKGSIQDNLFNWFTRVRGENAHIHGYYIGLVAPGGMSARNEKAGILFSNQNGVTSGFRTFNENRSLFEVLLPAQHGSPRSYEMTADGLLRVCHDAFVEKDMIETNVLPVATQVIARFREITDLFACTSAPEETLFSMVYTRHRRMVFQPSRREIEWMLSVSHVENFGVFEESRFGAAADRPTFVSRLLFTKNLLSRRSPSEIGFWPYLTLHQQALYGLGILYRWFRRWQEGLG
jgi:predicted O-methyltransferase YrrM